MSDPSLTTIRVKPRALARLVQDALEADLVPYVSASPGVGKSSIIKQVSNRLNLCCIDHRLSTSEPTDMSGLPNFDKDGYACFAPFRGIFPVEGTELPVRRTCDADGRVVREEEYDGWNLFLDELPAAPRNVQAAAFKLILDRMVGQHRLHRHVVITAAGNLLTDRSVVNPLVTAMQSRLVHLELQVDAPEWLKDVAMDGGFDPRIIGFIGQFPEKLMDFRPDHHDRTFACPRTWEFTNNLLSTYTRKKVELGDAQMPLVVGILGTGVGLEFVEYCKMWTKLVTPAQVLADPVNCVVPSEANIKYATVSMIMHHVDHGNFGKFATYVDRMTMDFRILFYRLVHLRDPSVRQHPEWGPRSSVIAQHLWG